MDEFELIRRFFVDARPAERVLLGIGDDGAVLEPAQGSSLVAVVDTLIESVHFPKGFAAADLGYRCVAVNLSDIAAMGATPRWMTLALTLTDTDTHWLTGFASGMRAAADAWSMSLVGGDTTRGSQLTATVQVLGELPIGSELRRDGAQPGDSVFVSGSVGDAAAGLGLWAEADKLSAEQQFLAQRFARPTPRLALGKALRGLASAAIDVSDGLLGDLSKLLRASDCGASVALDSLPLSAALKAQFDAVSAERLALTGGDDYELCFCVPPDRVDELLARAAALDETVTCIGRIERQSGLVCIRNGRVIEYDAAGYRHFTGSGS